MMLQEDRIRRLVDRYLVDRFAVAAEVGAKKSRAFSEMAKAQPVSRHFAQMAEANERAKKQLEAILPHLPEED